MSTDDSFKKNRRFSRLAPTILFQVTVDAWRSQSTSFPKRVISCFHQTLFLFINWISRQLDRSHTTSTDTSHVTLLFLLTKRSYRTYWTLVICRAVPRYVLALLENGHQWDGVSSLTGTLQERKRQRVIYLSLSATLENLLTQYSGSVENQWG